MHRCECGGQGSAERTRVWRAENPRMTPEALSAEIAAVERPAPPLWTYYVLKAIASNIAFPITIVLLYFRYHTMRYRFDAQGIHMRRAIIMRAPMMLNCPCIQ